MPNSTDSAPPALVLTGGLVVDGTGAPAGIADVRIEGGLMLGWRLRMEKLASLVSHGKLDPGLMVTHTFKGFENIEKALLLMKDKPADLIKPVVIF